MSSLAMVRALVQRSDSQGSNNGDPSNGSNNQQSITVLLGAVLGIVVLFFLSLAIAVYFNRRARKDTEGQPGKGTSERLQRLEAVAPTRSLGEWWPTVKESLNLSREVDNHFVCVVCFDQVEQTQEIHELKCIHVFHKECLERWYLRGHYTCPMCHRIFLHERRRPTTDMVWMV